MIFGILVVYSENYFSESLLEFNRLLKLTARDYKLIVVFNNHHLAKKIDSFALSGVEYDSILGTNQFHEFSAWDEGLDFVKNKYANHYKESGYIFCNDTFCQHRTYTFFHRLVYSIGSRRALISSEPTIAGEIHHLSQDFKFNHVKFNSWVSSYFFTLNKHAMKLMDFNVLPSNEMINQYLHGGEEENHFFSEDMDSTLKKHLLHNLFHGGWYKSEPLNQVNKNLFYAKARSVLAELDLSSKAHANKLVFIDTYCLNKFIGRLTPKKLRDKIRLLLN